MKNWDYFELIATYYRAYFALVEQGINVIEANNRIIDDFYSYPENENILSNLISIIQNINIQVCLSKRVFKGSVEVFNRQLHLINDELLIQELSTKEVEHLKESIEELQVKLKTTELS